MSPRADVLWSFEETLTVLGTLLVVGIAYKLFGVSRLALAAVGAVTAVAIAYATFFEFTLQHDAVTYRNRFMQTTLPLAWLEKVSVKTFWGGLPGRTYMFLMRRPPAPWNGYFRRTGLLTWPSADQWVGRVNAAIHKARADGSNSADIHRSPN